MPRDLFPAPDPIRSSMRCRCGYRGAQLYKTPCAAIILLRLCLLLLSVHRSPPVYAIPSNCLIAHPLVARSLFPSQILSPSPGSYCWSASLVLMQSLLQSPANPIRFLSSCIPPTHIPSSIPVFLSHPSGIPVRRANVLPPT